MNDRLTAFAWLLFAAFVVMLAGAIYVGFNPSSGEPIRVIDALWAASFVGFPLSGALVVSRLPRRPLGWILCLGPLLVAIGLVMGEAARPGPGGASTPEQWLGWGGAVAFATGIGLILFIPLFLPDGRVASPRWRWVARLLGICVLAWVVSAAFAPGPVEIAEGLENPLGVEALRTFFEWVERLLSPVSFAAVGAGAFSLVTRFRGSSGRERQQLKWLALGAASSVGCFLAIAVTEALIGDLSDTVVTLIIMAAILSLPISIAIAVLRTRLYDVDVVINKTLVYATLSAILAFSYLLIVVVLQSLFGDLLRGSDLFVAGSTLAVAALFRPLRGAVQGFIDRRFYRRKYDATETLGEFSGRLRDLVDLDSLNRELLGVVGKTMHPAHASVWLREAPE